jgi:hypothetical protein
LRHASAAPRRQTPHGTAHAGIAARSQEYPDGVIAHVGHGHIGQPVVVEVRQGEECRRWTRRQAHGRIERAVTSAEQQGQGPVVEVGRDGVQPAVPVHVAQRHSDRRGERKDDGIREPRGRAEPDDELVAETVTRDHEVVPPVGVQVSRRDAGGAVATVRLG